MADEIKRDVTGYTRLSLVPGSKFSRCDFCGEQKREPMVRMMIEVRGTCTELDACGQCLDYVGVREILPEEKT